MLYITDTNPSLQVQRYRSDPLSCLSTHGTRIHVFKASRIPEPPADAARALENTPGQSSVLPNQQIFRFVSALYHSIDKSRIPELETFTVAASQALHVKQKFQELSNIREGTFFDFIVMAVKQPFEMGDCVTLWVTDYTENDAFYPMLEHGASDGLYDDPMGYAPKEDREWKGPTGKMSLQVTCWEPHASAIRSRVNSGTYIRMRNVQVKFGRNGANLEGFLRGDMRNPGKVLIEVLDPLDDPEDIDPKLKALLYRRRDYMRAKKRSEDTATKEEESKKRKTGNEAPKEDNSRARRAKKRKAHLKSDEKSSQEDRTKLNPLGKYSPLGYYRRSGHSCVFPLHS